MLNFRGKKIIGCARDEKESITVIGAYSILPAIKRNYERARNFEESKKRVQYSNASKKLNNLVHPIKFNTGQLKKKKEKTVDMRLKILDCEYNDTKIFQEATKISKSQNYSELVNINALTENWNKMAEKIQDAQMQDQLEVLKQKQIRTRSVNFKPSNTKEK
jgi:hypothetical protein